MTQEMILLSSSPIFIKEASQTAHEVYDNKYEIKEIHEKLTDDRDEGWGRNNFARCIGERFSYP